jgi:arylsulfatase A-like enzyme
MTVTRRELGKLAGLAAMTAALPACTRPRAPAAPRSTAAPNLLVILGDDLGWGDLGAYGSTTIRTPHLDALAQSGVRFTDGYAAAAVCSPTRLALYTGRYPARLRAGLEEPIDAPDPQIGLPPEHPTLASLVRSRGYATAMLGKWHCGYLPEYSPIKSGWDEFFGNYSGGVDYYSKYSYTGAHDLYEREVEVESLAYYTDTLAERAVEFLHRDHRRPWLLNLNFTSPHWPWEAPGDTAWSAEVTQRLRDGKDSALKDGGSRETYVRMVESLDAAIGQVLDALHATGQDAATLVWFASDNGGERYSDQGPLRGRKRELAEGGIRVPMIVRWPGQIEPGRLSHEPVITQDWTATFLALAGAAASPDYPPDGRSLVDHLRTGAPVAPGDLFWRTHDARALRRGRWKYLRTTAGAAAVDALYDLDADLGETSDQAEAQPAVLADLRTRWEAIDRELLPDPAASGSG